MERRTAFGAMSTTAAAFSAAGFWAGIVNDIAWAVWFGAAGFALALTGLLGLLLTDPAGNPFGWTRGFQLGFRSKFVPIEDAAKWVYANGSDDLKRALREGIPNLWESIAEAGRAYIINSADAAGYKVYVRREPGLPWEVVEDTSEVDFPSFEAVFASERIKYDLAVRRADLGRIKGHLEK